MIYSLGFCSMGRAS